MAYATSLPPQLLVPSFNGRPALWVYASTDSTTVVLGTGYITNGSNLGMKVDDFVLSTVTSTNAMALGKVTTVTASSAATITFGTLTSTT